MLLRGTELHAKRKELGLVEGVVRHPMLERLQEFIPHVIETPTMSQADWFQMAQLAADADHGKAPFISKNRSFDHRLLS